MNDLQKYYQNAMTPIERAKRRPMIPMCHLCGREAVDEPLTSLCYRCHDRYAPKPWHRESTPRFLPVRLRRTVAGALFVGLLILLVMFL